MTLLDKQAEAKLRASQLATRRHFLGDCVSGLGVLWAAENLGGRAQAGLALPSAPDPARPLAPRSTPLAAKARHVIFLHMAGAPSQFELFEHKPELRTYDGRDCPAEFLAGKRFAFIRGVPKLLGPVYPFHQAGRSGAWLSDRLPSFERVIDKVCFVRSMQTDQFNHAPAQLLAHTGNPRLGYASIGSWVTYGLGSENQNLPGYVVLLSGGKFPDAGKSAWSAGFLPSVYQGVQCRSQGDPVLFLSNPPGIDARLRGRVIDAIHQINQQTFEDFGDPEILTRISQYEMAHRMQLAASDAMDLRKESAAMRELYGAEPGAESFANNCLLARRLVERGVRYVQLFDWGWDAHGAAEFESLNGGFKVKCGSIDRAVTALLVDLEQRGLLDETLVVWGGEFGRTPMRENRGGTQMPFIGRDHHADAFTIWLAGAGIKPGFSYGQTDPLGFATVGGSVQWRDIHATMQRLLGVDHQRLTYNFQGLSQKLTGVLPARVVDEILA